MTLVTRNILLKGAVIVLLAWSSILCCGAQSISDDFTDRRITAGTKIFRALLAADSKISQKKTVKGTLDLCLVYLNDQKNAELAADILFSRSESNIRGIRINSPFVPFVEFVTGEHRDCAGIFLAEQLKDKELAQVIAIAGKEKRVLFSPFEGDVERGVLGGIKVESRVLPYVNNRALQESHLTLKAFFMKIAKTYED